MNNQRFEAFNALYLPPPFIHLFIKRVLLLVLFFVDVWYFLFSIFLNKNTKFVSCADDSSLRPFPQSIAQRMTLSAEDGIVKLVLSASKNANNSVSIEKN